MAACVQPVPLIGRHALLAAAAVGAVAAVTVLCALAELFCQLWRLHRFRRCLLRLPRAVGPAAGLSVVLPHRLVVLETEQPCCLTMGFLRPRVVVSTGFASLLSPAEMGAALAHETANARRRDPLRLLVALVAASAVFFAPSLKDLARAAHASEEIEADKAAVAAFGRPALLGALRAFVPTSSASPTPVPLSSLTHSAVLAKRLAALLGDYPHLVVPRARAILSLGATVALATLALAIPTYVERPMPLQVHRITPMHTHGAAPQGLQPDRHH
jgi:hypothetical protein